MLQKRKLRIPSKRFRNKINEQKEKCINKFWDKYEIYQNNL